MATHSHILAWEIPWIEGLGRLQSIGLQRVKHDLATKQHVTWARSTMATPFSISLTKIPRTPL